MKRIALNVITILLTIHLSKAAIITVINTDNAGPGSFREALTSAGNGDEIRFNIPGTGPHLISLESAITINKNNLIIDATTEPDYTCGNPAVIFDMTPAWPTGFIIQGTNNRVKGISFRSVFFTFDGGGSNQLQGCWFNLNNTGTGVSGNHVDINLMRFMNNSINNSIGGTTCDTRNVFSMGGTTDTWGGAIKLNTGSTGNTFTGNYFGTDKTGMNVLSQNADHFIYISGATGITFDQNVVSGANPLGASGGAGFYVDGTTSGLTLTNNKIGVRSDGTDGGTSFGNAFGGVAIASGICNNFVFNNNIVCRNGLVIGADIKKCGLYFAATSTSIQIKNNYIGVTPTYQKAGNYFAGIFINAASSNIVIDNNIIGDNGGTLTDGDESHGLSLEQPCTNVTITNNFVGGTPTGTDIGNFCSGITISGGSNYTLRNNFVGFNRGLRNTIPNACLVFTNTTDVVIQGNKLGGRTATGAIAGQRNMGLHIYGGRGIFISGGSAARYRIGGMAASDLNIIAYNAQNGIEVQNADYVEMRYNSIYCNGSDGIQLNYGTAQQGNNGFGNGTLTITGPVPTKPTSLSGTRPNNSIVDVFGTNFCSSSLSCISQGQYRYAAGTYTPSASGIAGTAWSYNHGGEMFDDLSALATGAGADCNSGFCRTSEFSPCVDNELPVTYISFEGVNEDGLVTLLWKTAQEKNSAFFSIEKSTDGINFNEIGKVTAAGNSSTITSYEFNDPQLIAGNCFYRLRQVDLNGKYYYSKIIVLKTGHEILVSVSPNPNNGLFNLDVSNVSGKIEIQVLNLLGQSVYATTFPISESNTRLPIDLTIFPKGVYLLSIISSDGLFNTRLVIE